MAKPFPRYKIQARGHEVVMDVDGLRQRSFRTDVWPLDNEASYRLPPMSLPSEYAAQIAMGETVINGVDLSGKQVSEFVGLRRRFLPRIGKWAVHIELSSAPVVPISHSEALPMEPDEPVAPNFVNGHHVDEPLVPVVRIYSHEPLPMEPPVSSETV